ncbi:MAG: PH domain-containing protein [Candidatus Nezhaarchaeales archaeon]
MSTLHEFSAPYDRMIKVVTSIVIALMSILFAYITYLVVTEVSNLGILIVSLLTLLYFLIVFVPYLFSPSSFALTTKGVLIKRPLRSILIPYSEVIDFKRISDASIMKGVRIWGSGGLYGFIGLFRISGLGKVWMYVTDRSKMVLIETKRNVKYVISPSDPLTFIERLRSLAPGAGQRP